MPDAALIEISGPGPWRRPWRRPWTGVLRIRFNLDLSGTAREASAYLHNQPHNHQRQSGTASMAKLFIGGLVFDGIAKPVSGQGVLVEEIGRASCRERVCQYV